MLVQAKKKSMQIQRWRESALSITYQNTHVLVVTSTLPTPYHTHFVFFLRSLALPGARASFLGATSPPPPPAGLHASDVKVQLALPYPHDGYRLQQKPHEPHHRHGHGPTTTAAAATTTTNKHGLE